MFSFLLAATLLLPGPEQPVMDPQVTGAIEQVTPKIATGRSVQLIVWKEIDKTTGQRAIRAVRAVRVNRSVVILDPQPIEFSHSADIADPPSVAFDGEEFFVVWTDAQSDGPFSWARRVGENGNLFDDFLPIGKGGFDYALACGDAQCGIPIATLFWLFRRDQTESIRTFALAVPSPQQGNSTAFGDHTFLVATTPVSDAPPFENGVAVQFVRDETVIKHVTLRDLTPGAPVNATHVAWNGSEFIVLWQVATEGRLVLYGERFSASGDALDMQRVIETTGAPGSAQDVSFVNGSWLITFTDGGGALPLYSYGLYVSPTLVRERAFLIGAGVSNPKLASDGLPVMVYQRTSSESGNRNRVFLRELSVPADPEPLLPKRRAVGRR